MKTETKTMYEEIMKIVNGDIYSITDYSFFKNKNSEFYEMLFSELFKKEICNQKIYC